MAVHIYTVIQMKSVVVQWKEDEVYTKRMVLDLMKNVRSSVYGRRVRVLWSSYWYVITLQRRLAISY